MTIAEFLAMGGYAAFVWPAYLISLVVLVANLYYALRQKRKQLHDKK